MRWITIISLILLCVSPAHSSLWFEKVTTTSSAVDEYRWPRAVAVSTSAEIPPSYSTEIVGYGVDGKHVKVINAAPNYAISIYGGWLLGADRGEWGGELVFRGQDGKVHRLIEENVQGIVSMPFGVVVFTGLSHMSISNGAIYTVRLDADRIPHATELFNLAGAPSDIRWTTKHELLFKVQPGLHSMHDFFNTPATQCFLLNKNSVLRKIPCSDIVAQH